MARLPQYDKSVLVQPVSGAAPTGTEKISKLFGKIGETGLKVAQQNVLAQVKQQQNREKGEFLAGQDEFLRGTEKKVFDQVKMGATEMHYQLQAKNTIASIAHKMFVDGPTLKVLINMISILRV